MSSTAIIIWVVVIGAVFGYLWWQGQIRRFADYCQEVKDELVKCSWPTWAELKGSTTVIIITLLILTTLVVAIDEGFFVVFFKLLKLT